MNKTRNSLLTVLSIIGLFLFLWYASIHFNKYSIRIMNDVAIFMMLAVSYNLINGVTGQFSLEPNGFTAIGAYVSSLLTLTTVQKHAMFIIVPMIHPFDTWHLPFLAALIVGGLVTSMVAFVRLCSCVSCF